MALIGKREDLVHVPWSSVEEWLQVYKQIYTGNQAEQKKAYDTLLVWKARIPKLPVGVECTLGLIQVCLRDSEYTPKIHTGELSITYENDIRMMYSTVIMKFLNHISNIAHTKQTSLFIIAKQLNIPEWIVELRHDIAHGHELPSIDVMRVVANILLTWLHEEYWAAETKNLEVSQDFLEMESFSYKDEENLTELLELYTAIGLYLKTNHQVISDLPNNGIRESLTKLFSDLNVSSFNGTNGKSFSITNETELSTVSNVLLSEISKNLNKGDSPLRREKLIIDSVITNEAFLTNLEIFEIFLEGNQKNSKTSLPKSLLDFWLDFLLLLQEKKMLLPLFLRLIELIKGEKDADKALIASLWLKALAQAFNKLKLARHIYQMTEQKNDHENLKLNSKSMVKLVQNEMEKRHPELTDVLSLNVLSDFPTILENEGFIRRLVLNFNQYSENYVPEILKLSSSNCDSSTNKKLMNLIKIHSTINGNEKMDTDSSPSEEKIYTVEDIKKLKRHRENDEFSAEERIYTVEDIKKLKLQNTDTPKKTESKISLADDVIRNTDWSIVHDKYDWSSCPIGILPWQMNGYEVNQSLTVSLKDIRYAKIKNLELPKIVNSTRLKLHNKIQWDSLLKKQKKLRKKVKT